MNVNLYVIEDYKNENTLRPKKTNPIQTQTNPISKQLQGQRSRFSQQEAASFVCFWRIVNNPKTIKVCDRCVCKSQSISRPTAVISSISEGSISLFSASTLNLSIISTIGRPIISRNSSLKLKGAIS